MDKDGKYINYCDFPFYSKPLCRIVLVSLNGEHLGLIRIVLFKHHSRLIKRR